MYIESHKLVSHCIEQDDKRTEELKQQKKRKSEEMEDVIETTHISLQSNNVV